MKPITGAGYGLAIVLAASICTAALPTETQTFNTALSAAADGWVENGSRVSPQNYGFSASTNAAGASGAGEAGGTFHLTSTRSYYADETVLNGLNQSTRLEASGKIEITNAATTGMTAFIAHFDSSQTLTRNIIGIAISDHNAGGGFVRFGGVFYADTGQVQTEASLNVPTAGLDRFEYVFDPDPDNNPITPFAQLTSKLIDINNVEYVHVTGTSLSTTNLNAWGLRSQSSNEVTNPIVMFIDDVTYTAPEPGCVLSAVGLAGILLGRRRRLNQ